MSGESFWISAGQEQFNIGYKKGLEKLLQFIRDS